jgi:hippurate hydrolase
MNNPAEAGEAREAKAPTSRPLPQTAVIRGTFRTFSNDTIKQIENGMRRIAFGVAAAFGATAKVDLAHVFAPLVNNPAETGSLLLTLRLISSARRTFINIGNAGSVGSCPSAHQRRVLCGDAGSCSYFFTNGHPPLSSGRKASSAGIEARNL